jgi:hypothetical protein
MATAPPPSIRGMDEYRLSSGCGLGDERAANGERKSMYGKEGTPVPFHLGTIYNEDLDPITQLVANWFMDPFLEYVSRPFRCVLS